MFKALVVLCIFLNSWFVMGQTCESTDTSGFVDVPTVHQFSQDQTNFWPRSKEIDQALSKSGVQNSKFQLYYELAEKFDPTKKTLLILGGFYPWTNLNFAKNGPMNFLMKNFNLIEIHFRGSGCSIMQEPVNDLAFTHEMIAMDIELLRQKFNINKFNIWASSNGSWVALMFSVLNPNSVENVYLRDTAINQPTLKDASVNFETQILPDFLGADLTQKLEYIKLNDNTLYKKTLKYSGTMLFRKAAQRDFVKDIVGIFYDTLGSNDPELQNLIMNLDQKIQEVEPWSHAVFANECVRFNDEDFLLNIEDVSVVEYVHRRCKTYNSTSNSLTKISDLDFRGHLGHLTNSFFIYQGYWDEYLYKELAIELNNQLKNSQIFIDPRAGHGEITSETISCFANTMNHFLNDPKTLDPIKYCN